jgi:hypothetical protein
VVPVAQRCAHGEVSASGPGGLQGGIIADVVQRLIWPSIAARMRASTSVLGAVRAGLVSSKLRHRRSPFARLFGAETPGPVKRPSAPPAGLRGAKVYRCGAADRGLSCGLPPTALEQIEKRDQVNSKEDGKQGGK